MHNNPIGELTLRGMTPVDFHELKCSTSRARLIAGQAWIIIMAYILVLLLSAATLPRKGSKLAIKSFFFLLAIINIRVAS